MGVAQTRVSALRAVKGDVVTYVDGDDRILKHKLEVEATALEKNAVCRYSILQFPVYET